MASMMPVLVALPDHPYYLWQALVQNHALQKLGYEPTYLIYSVPAGKPLPELTVNVLESRLLHAIVWNDWRRTAERSYHPAMKPWLVGRYFEAYPDKVDEPHLLLDPDAVITGAKRLPTPSESRWYATDTDDYTGPGYLKEKGVWEKLTQLVGLSPEQVAEAEKHKGAGAQLAFVGQGHEFWYKVANDSLVAFTELDRVRQGTRQADGPVQSWCAEMYVTQLEAARRGIELRAVPSMSMVWANGPASGWGSSGFFHDAGVTPDNSTDGNVQHFVKTEYQSSPFGQELSATPASASHRYVELIREFEAEHPDVAALFR